MPRTAMLLSCVAALAVAVSLSGCGGEGAEQTENLSPEEAKIQKALAQLPEADQAAAKAQKTCPVSDEPLGDMGTPIKITVKDSDGKEHEVFLCCASCEDAIEDDPDTYLANLKK